MLQPKDTDWLNAYKKQDPYICCLQETHFRPKDTYRLKVRGSRNMFHAYASKALSKISRGRITSKLIL